MAAEADIQVPVPVCETGGDQVGNFVDNIINISVSKHFLEKHTRDDQQNEHPTVEGENFLKPPLTAEVHSEVNKVIEEPNQAEGTDTLLLSNKLDGQPVEVTAHEGTSVVEIQQSGEESNTTVKNGDNGTDSSVVIPEVKVEDKLDDCEAGLATQLSNDTGSDHQGTHDSITANIAITKEILHETSLPIEETESQAPLTSESEEKPTEEDVSCDLRSEGSKEGESDQCKTTSEEEKLANERIAGDNSDAVAEEVSQVSTPVETVEALETSNNDEVESKSDLNSSFSKEDETTLQNDDKINTASENSGVLSENTLSENCGGEECQSENLDNDGTDHGIPALEEKSEEISPVKVRDSQIECDEHLEEETERLPLTELSKGDTNDNVQPVTHDVKDKDEGLIEAELSENEPSTRCLSVEKDGQIETPAETLLVTTENTEASNLSQENSIQGPPEEQSTNADLHESTIQGEEATIDAVDAQKEALESCLPIVSSSPKKGSIDAVPQEQEVTNDHVEVLENLPLGEGHTEINNIAPNFTEDTEELHQTARDGKVDSDVNEETPMEEIQPNAEVSNSTEKEGDGGAVPEQCSTDSSVMTSKVKAGDALNDPDVDDARVVSQLSKDTSIDQHGKNNSCNENIALPKEILEETNIPNAETESQTPCIREVEEQNVPVETADQSQDEKTTEKEISCDLRSEVSKEEESDQCKTASEPEVLANEISVEDSTNTTTAEDSQGSGAPVETVATLEASNNNELQSKSDLNSPFSTDEETTVQNGYKIEDSGVPSGNTSSESHRDEECQSRNLEDAAADHSYPKLEENSEKSSLVTEDSRVEPDKHLGEESERLPLTDVSGGASSDNLPPVTDIVEDKDGDLKEAELSELDARCTSEKEDRQIETHAESLAVAPRDIEASTLSKENSVTGPTQEQNTEAALHGNISEVEEATIDANDQQKESSESSPIVSSSPEEGSMNAMLQEVTSDVTDEKIIDEVDKHAEVPENLTIGDAHSEIHDVAPEITEVTEKPDQQVEFAADEEMSTEEIQQNVDDGDRGVVPEQSNTDSLAVTSEVKARDMFDDLDVDEARVSTQLSKDTRSNEQVDSFSENISVAKEILEETNILSEEIEPQASCIREGEELNVQVKTTDNKYEDEKPIEEDKSILTGEVSKEAESDQNTASEKEVFTSVDNFNTAAEDVSQENSTSTETITTLGASTSNELQSKSKEDETTVHKCDSSATKSEDYGVPLENSLKENHGDVECECPPKTLEDAATDHSESKLAEKSAESSLDQIEDSQLECDEHLKVESEGLPLTEVSTVGTEDNISEATDKVKDGDEDLKEDAQIEHIADSLHVECPVKEQGANADLHGNGTEEQGTAISEGDDQLKESLQGVPPIVSSSSEEESTNATLKQVTGDHTDNIIEEVDKHKEVLENVLTTTSTENTEGNSLIELEESEVKKEDDLGKETEETPLPLPLAREVGDESLIFQESQFKDEESTNAGFCNTERSTETVLLKTEPRTENTEDISNVNSEDNTTPVLSQETETSSVIEEKDISAHTQGILHKRSDCGTVGETEVKEDTLENVATEIPHEYIAEHSVTQVDCAEREDEEHLEKDNQSPSLKEATVEETHSMDCESEKIEEADVEKHVDSLLDSQVKPEDIKQHDSSLDMNNSIKEEIPDTDPQEISRNSTEKGPVEAVDTDELNLEAKDMQEIIANTTLYEDKEENLQLGEDCSQLEQYEDLGNESTPLTEDPKVYTTESSTVKEEEQVEKHVEEQITTTDPLEASEQENAVDVADEKDASLEDLVVNVPNEDNRDSSPKEADGSQEPPSEEAPAEAINDDEPTAVCETNLADENAAKANLFEEEKKVESALTKEEVCIESLQVADKDIEATSSVQDKEASHLEDQAPATDSQGTSSDQKDGKTSHLADEEEIVEDKEKSLNLAAEKAPGAEDLDASEGIIGNEVSNYEQQEPSITEVSEEHMAMGKEHAPDNTALESEVSEKNNDGANTCDDKIDSDKIEVSNDGSIAVPTNETLAETDSIGSTEAEVQAPNGEKHAELSIKEAEIDQKNIKETQLYNASEYVPELEGVDEEKTDSNNCDEIPDSSNYVASQEVSTSNVAVNEDLASNSSQEPRRETREEAEIEEPQDSSMENIERDAKLCPASANDSGITQMEVPIHVREENIIETADCKEDDVVEGATNNEEIGHLEQADTTKSYSDDKKPTEEVLEETVAIEKLPESPSEVSEVDRCSNKIELTNKEDLGIEKTASGDDEKEARDEKISDISSAAPDAIHTRDMDVVKLTDNSDNILGNTEDPMVNENTSVECILDNESSATYLETKNDDEATKINETIPSDADCQDLKSANVEENSNYPGSLIEEKSNSDEVAFVPGENKSGYASNDQEPKSVAQALLTDNTSEQEETMSQKEILKDDISNEKEQSLTIKAEDEVTKDDQGSCKEEEVIGNSHQEEEVKQEQQKISKETTEFIEDASKVSEETEDKALEDQEEEMLTNEAIDGILHEEEQAKSIEELTNKTDAEDSNKEENIVFSEGKSEAEANEANAWTKPNEDEDKEAPIEAKKLETEGVSECKISGGAHIPEEDDVSTTKNTSPGEDYPSKSIESSGSEDIAVTEQASEATVFTAEVQEAKAGTDLGAAVPRSTGIESREVEDVDDTCAATEPTPSPAEPPAISASKITPEWKVGTPLESEDQQTKLHDLPKEVDIKDSEVKMSEKDDAVNLLNVRDIRKDVQELSEESFEVSSNENPESGIHHSSVDNAAQHEKGEGRQINSLPSLSQAPCSDIKTSEKDLLVPVPGSGRIDVAELEASPLPSKDKHVVLEVDAKNLNHENLVDNKNISTEEKPSKVEQEAECGNDARTDQEMEEKSEPKETEKSSLSDLFQVSMREHTQVADHSATEKEPTSQTGDLRAENSDEAEHENSKTDEEKDDEEESHEQGKSDSVSEAPVMVDMGDADVKVSHKKSHNILSGVGSKVKHSIAKVKKVITGKSSHPKPPSPKKVTN